MAIKISYYFQHWTLAAIVSGVNDTSWLGRGIMRLGFFTMPIHPLDKPWQQSLREDREAFLLADELGFTEGFVGEHATDQAENITSSIAFIASLADATRNIKLGTGTVNLPNNHPAAVASQIAMLDHMLDGRLIFGISPGGLLSDAEAFGTLDSDRRAMFAESIAQILAIWAGTPPYDIKGKYWSVSTARTLMQSIGQGILPKPLQQPHPPIIVTAVTPFSSSVTEAAIRGWDVISANFLMPVWVKSHWSKWLEGCEKSGRAVDPGQWRVAKSVFVADDEATARAYATAADSPYRYYYRQIVTKMQANGRLELFKPSRDMPDAEVTHDYVFDKLVIYGTPEKVIDELNAFRETVGDFGTLLYAGHDWKDRELARRSMVLMAEKVLPGLNA
jgi:alkanesulfonate monooxygenase SsuD/methylene tetrahydromethanopterin reductase-like flavin-dependent oxidoreductase (luciferase family)